MEPMANSVYTEDDIVTVHGEKVLVFVDEITVEEGIRGMEFHKMGPNAQMFHGGPIDADIYTNRAVLYPGTRVNAAEVFDMTGVIIIDAARAQVHCKIPL